MITLRVWLYARCVPDITFGAVSLQLNVLLDAGLVECQADRQFRVYCIRRDALSPVADI